jgi:hypothetical protein
MQAAGDHLPAIGRDGCHRFSDSIDAFADHAQSGFRMQGIGERASKIGCVGFSLRALKV